jgi:isoamylase
MNDEAWSADFVRALGVRLAGDAIDEHDNYGHRITGDTMLLLFNAHHDALPFHLPAHREDVEWMRLLDTKDPLATDGTWSGGDAYELGGRTLALFKLASRATDAPNPSVQHQPPAPHDDARE